VGPQAVTAICRSGRRIALYQVCDFMVPLPADVLLGRAMMGDGPIDFGPLTSAVAEAGYTGPIEVEIFNAYIWNTDRHVVLQTTIDRYSALIEQHVRPCGIPLLPGRRRDPPHEPRPDRPEEFPDRRKHS
jgi:hypothetical protein